MQTSSAMVRTVKEQGAWWLIKWLLWPYLTFWASMARRLHKPIVIGITGSVGKTTTTAMIASVLKHPEARSIVGTVGHTSNNLNDNSGVPLTILGHDDYLPRNLLARISELLQMPLRMLLTRDYPRVLVLELGTSRKGQLDRLAGLARPHIGVVTTVGPSHLERLGTVEGVAEEKSAVVRWTSPTGLVILGEDHDHVDRLRAHARAPVVTVAGRGIELARNIARAVGRHFGISNAAIEEALADAELPKRRLNRFEAGDVTVIDDSYNANPLSMKLGLDTLAASPCKRRIAVLGAMAELGNEAERYHVEIGAYARARADVMIGVGQAARGYNPDLWFPDALACADAIGAMLNPGDCVLIKGSGSIKMAIVAQQLKDIRVSDPLSRHEAKCGAALFDEPTSKLA